MRPETAWGLRWNGHALGPTAAWWATTAVYAAGIFVMSSTAHPFGIQRLPPGVDKMIHAAVFGGLSFTVWMALRSSAPRVSSIRLSVFAVLIATLYGVSDEFHQSFVPGRAMDVLDVAADGIGACVMQGMLLMRPAVRRSEPAGSILR